MKKLKMNSAAVLTFEEGCNKYLMYGRQRNLREGTINHYRQSYTQLYKYFDPQMPVTSPTFLSFAFTDRICLCSSNSSLREDTPSFE